jgi:FMN phosphatase YigB (HAD superfamily)
MALDRLDAEPARTVVIGNSLDDDVEGARRAGLRAIYLDEEAHDIEPLHRDGSVLRVRPSYETVSRALERLEEG